MFSYNLELYSLIFGFFGTYLFSKFWIRYFNFGYDSHDKIQTIHVSSALRIGGIINIIFIIFLCNFSNIFKEFPTILIIFIPIIIISTIEDIFQNVPIKVRFLFTNNNVVEMKGKGRHDPCVVPRAVPIVEAMAALVLVDFYLINKTIKL